MINLPVCKIHLIKVSAFYFKLLLIRSMILTVSSALGFNLSKASNSFLSLEPKLHSVLSKGEQVNWDELGGGMRGTSPTTQIF